MDVKKLQADVGKAFREAFGRTSLRARLQDILKEDMELQRWTDLSNLQEESGDLACSLLAFFDETGLDMEQAVQKTLDKIKKREAQYKSLGRKAKVAILGGAFDPPTLGHVAVAKFVLDCSREFDEVWLTPCYKHMYNKDLSPAEHRMEMLALATEGDGRIKVFDYEIIHELGGETYHFIKRLLDSDLSERCEFSYIIGMDNANHFDRWVNFEELERLIRFVVVPRVGETPDTKVDWYLNPPHVFLMPDSPLPETASSTVRECVSSYAPIRSRDLLRLVNEKVLDYILSHKLYAEGSE